MNDPHTKIVVTLDGPAGAGKSTIARKLAGRLGFRYLDTGAMYRAVTLVALEDGIDQHDGVALGALAKRLDLELSTDGRTLIGSRDVTQRLRDPDVTRAVSVVCAHGPVREAMTELQRRIGAEGNLVCEGRDMGTVVFPDAALKVYLDAAPEVRAARREKDLARAGTPTPFVEVLDAVNLRDRLDSERAIAPLKRISEQLFLDSSRMSVEEVLDQLGRWVADRLHGHQSESP